MASDDLRPEGGPEAFDADCWDLRPEGGPEGLRCCWRCGCPEPFGATLLLIRSPIKRVLRRLRRTVVQKGSMQLLGPSDRRCWDLRTEGAGTFGQGFLGSVRCSLHMGFQDSLMKGNIEQNSKTLEETKENKRNHRFCMKWPRTAPRLPVPALYTVKICMYSIVYTYRHIQGYQLHKQYSVYI